ncbi:MAG: hypothetical protein ACTHOG_11455 [Marmoricola sp.]
MGTVWFLRGWRKYVAAVLLVADLGVGGFSAAMAVTASSAAPTTSSGVTVSWTDSRHVYDPAYTDAANLDPSDKNQPLFKNLKVTVSQTRDLTDQGLQVSWSGGVPTGGRGAPSNYMQIMQCWGSAGASGPTPQQCQWGVPNSSIAAQMGLAAASRDLLEGSIADPKQLPNGTCIPGYTHAQFGQRPGCTVPFWSITDPNKTSLGWTNDQYNLPPYGAAQSNEVSYARTASDGTGQDIFNLQSALSAPYLGCGNAAQAAAGKTCWLVVVPRGEYDLNGDQASQQDQSGPYGANYNYVAGSPLSASAWQNRIQIQLHFSPIGASCQLGATAVRTAGTELISGAFSSWQAALCSQGTTFGYSEVTDGHARTALGSGGTAMNFMVDPPDSSTAPGATIKYAPVASSALVFSYLIDKNYTQDKANPDLGANGTLVTNLRLTPLIVAKLLTQSYRADTPGDGKGAGATVPASNPDSLLQDPDFLQLNPEFKYFYPTQIPDGLIVPFGDSDAATKLWAWLQSDPAAKSFLAGNPVNGATINSAYKDLNLSSGTINSFPKNDQSTYRTGDWPAPGFGTLDMRPYAADFADAAFRTVTANAGKKTNWDVTLTPPQATSVGPQVPGNRFEIAVTTSEAASLYGLPTAALVNSPSDTSSGVTATQSAMAQGIAGAAGGYPLTMRTYAAVNVCTTSLPDLAADAKFLDYAAGAGQSSGTALGQLPLGYLPLGSSDTGQASAMAAALRAEVKSPQCASHRKSTGFNGGGGGGLGSGTGAGGTGGTTGFNGGGSTPVGGSAGAVGGGKAAAAGAAPSTALAGSITPTADVTPAGQYALLAALCFFVPCAIAGPSLLLAGRSRT